MPCGKPALGGPCAVGSPTDFFKEYPPVSMKLLVRILSLRNTNRWPLSLVAPWVNFTEQCEQAIESVLYHGHNAQKDL